MGSGLVVKGPWIQACGEPWIACTEVLRVLLEMTDQLRGPIKGNTRSLLSVLHPHELRLEPVLFIPKQRGT